LSLTLGLTTHSAPIREETRTALLQLLKQRLNDLAEIEIALTVHERPAVKLGQVGLTAKSVIVVGSGKGGVGKSTIAASLAVGLKNAGCRVGLLDADVCGPSIPHLLGASGRPEVTERQTGSDEAGNPVMARSIASIEVGGIKVISIGFLVPADKAVVWRGPMLHGSITSFLRDTDWGLLDYLIIDMPPGTGDRDRQAITACLSQNLGKLGLGGRFVLRYGPDLCNLRLVESAGVIDVSRSRWRQHASVTSVHAQQVQCRPTEQHDEHADDDKNATVHTKRRRLDAVIAFDLSSGQGPAAS
jgi:hypothetical protein